MVAKRSGTRFLAVWHVVSSRTLQYYTKVCIGYVFTLFRLFFPTHHHEPKEINGIQYSRINTPEWCIYVLCICSFLSSPRSIFLILNALLGAA